MKDGIENCRWLLPIPIRVMEVDDLTAMVRDVQDS